MNAPRRKRPGGRDRRRVPLSFPRPHTIRSRPVADLAVLLGNLQIPPFEQADRLTLIDRWRNFVPDQPVLVYPGETIRQDDAHLLVHRLDGRVDAYPGSTNR
ncbi:hypothetical protein ACTWLT_03780 [Micromonospora sp. ZYX-F-536]|uniref:hypothetical protein n=1 Tax=Micromonospora sp. ZYX-F-536 TaxID=3457629 RepID=UPI0040407BE5